MDANLIRYASVIARGFKFTKVYFIHVEKNLELPEKVVEDYDEVLVPVDEGIEERLKQEVDRYFDAHNDISTRISIKEGNAVEKILRYSKVKNVDLILLGRKEKLRGSGVVTDNLARKSPCSLLLLPEDTTLTSLKKILVPVDFSSHSAHALELAMALSDEQHAEITAAHIYSVPAGYTRIGKTYDEFREIILGHTRNDFKKFVSRFDRPVKSEFLLAQNEDYADVLVDFVDKFKPDIVFVGSKGRTNASVLLLGSIAEKLTNQLVKTPLFIVKQKEENLGFFEALMKI
jgi:nucleotide-binding universal stress UspA family protein